MTEFRQNLLRFFERPAEPCFMQKGEKKLAFHIPDHYYPDDYKHCSKSSALMDSDQLIKVKDISFNFSDLSLPLQLPRDEQFSFFIPEHRKMAGRLIKILMEMKNCEELQAVCAYCQIHVNPYLFNYCLSIVVLHREDTRGLDFPTYAETFPDKFIDRKTLRRAQRLCAILPDNSECPVIDVEFRTPKTPEQRMEYFREDIGVNSHHWHWHLIYPTDATEGVILEKDRRGELFYYMHHQIMARYNVERMVNGLERTKPYVNFNEPLAEGYFPKMDSTNASRIWAPRYDNTSFRDVDRPGSKSQIRIPEMDIWRKNILEAITTQTVLNVKTNQHEPLDEETGIDTLGNLLEATSMSINPDYYGDYHNQAHMLIAYSHDPDEYHSESTAVMGDSAMAMRDPSFFRIHANVDELFIMYKDQLTPYEPDKLIFPDITVSSIGIENAGDQNTNNTFSTLWERSKLNIRYGLDFQKDRDLYVRVKHLQHEDFKYVIEVNNTSGKLQIGTVRIFLAPTVDQDGFQLSFDEQRLLMIEMDKFSQPLDPGKNTFRRRSSDSSVTIPFERIFRARSGADKLTSESTFCDCGWPQNLLLPKGTPEGYPMVLFVMVSNWNEDKVDQDIMLTGANNYNASYCGLRDRKYPDRRAMGFPFDRKAKPDVESLSQFLQPNMAFEQCTIKFTDITRDRVEKQGKQDDNEGHHETEEAPRECGWPRKCNRPKRSEGSEDETTGPRHGHHHHHHGHHRHHEHSGHFGDH